MRPKTSQILLFLALPVVLFFGIYLGGHSDLLPGPVRDLLVADRETQVFNEALDLIERDYYRKESKSKLVNHGITGAVDSLHDRFSAYLDPQAYKLFGESSSAQFSGVGMNVLENKRGLRVVEVFPNSPAKKAGIKPDDLIIKVNKRSLRGLSSRVATSFIKGEPGTGVTLTVRSGKKTRIVPLKRARIQVPVVKSSLRTVKGKKVAIVRLGGFTEGAHVEVNKAVKRRLSQGADAVVLDLRGNGGGFLNEAVAVSSIFIDNGTIVSTEGRNSPKRVFKATGGAISPKIPVTVLVDHDSASASEIVSAALQDRGRAKVVGARTFGKGVFQEIMPLSNGGALDLTVGEYFTPSGRNLGGGGVKRGAGVKPDITAKDLPKTKPDEALNKALDQVVNQSK